MSYITRALPFNPQLFFARLNEGTLRRFCCRPCTPLRLHGGREKQNKKQTEQNPPANKVKTTASRTLVYPTSTPPLSGPSGHISVMASHRSRGLLVCTQCPLIGRNAKESRRTASHPVAWRLACAVCEISLFYFYFFRFSGEKSTHLHAGASLCFTTARRQASVPLLCLPVMRREALNPLNCLAAGPCSGSLVLVKTQ